MPLASIMVDDDIRTPHLLSQSLTTACDRQMNWPAVFCRPPHRRKWRNPRPSARIGVKPVRRLAQWGDGGYLERRPRLALPCNNKPIDGQRRRAMLLLKFLAEEPQRATALLHRQRPGQCHVKAEILADVWIAPAREVDDLAIAQSRRHAARTFLLAHRRPEAVESAHAGFLSLIHIS